MSTKERTISWHPVFLTSSRLPLVMVLTIFLFLQFVCVARMNAQEFIFKEVMRDGDIAGGSINILHEDSAGFIWMGTSTGLYRTDGHELELIQLPDSIAANMITAIASPDKANVLVGLDNGALLRYDYQIGLMSYFGRTEGNSGVKEILVSTMGVVWVASYDMGVTCFGDSIIVFHERNGMLSNYNYCLELDKLGRIWSGTDGGINIISGTPDNPSIESISPSTGLSDYMVTALHSTPVGKMIIGFESGHLEFIEPTSDSHQSENDLIQLSNSIEKIISVGGEIWILSRGECYVYNAEGHSLAEKLDFAGLNSPPGEIRDILLDAQGNVWLAGKNALLLSPASTLMALQKVNDFSYYNAQTAISDRKGRLWFSIRNKLYLEADDNESQPQLVLSSSSNSSIISLYEDFMGLLWIGTFNDGLYLLDPETGFKRMLNETTGLNDNNVLSITGQDENIWISSLGGVFIVRPNRSIFKDNRYPDKDIFQTDPIQHLNFVYDINIDKNKRTWFGTDGYGVFSWTDGLLTGYPVPELEDAVILSIAEDPEGNLWFATTDIGFFRYDGDVFTQFTSEGGLRSGRLEGLETDQEGNLVILHDKGIDIYNPEMDNYYYIDDLTDKDLRGSGFNSISKGIDGSIWISSGQGISRLLPDEINKRFKGPKTIITSVEVLNKRIDHNSQIEFKHSENHFRFSITSIWHAAPERIRYRYKLEGVDSDWSVSRLSQVSYSALPPGSYTFSIESSYNNKFSEKSESSYEFLIQKPLWRKTWFVALVSCLLLSILYRIIRIRDKKYREREATARKQLSLQLENLQNQVNPHFLFNSFNTLVSVIDENPRVAIDYVENLSDFFRNVLLYRDRDLIPVREELNLLRAYTYLQKKRYGDSLTLEIGLSDKVLDSLIPPLSLQILVENAVKHNIVSEEKPLLVKISEQEEEITVENILQPKKNAEPSTKTGLENIKNRYEMLGGAPVRVKIEDNRFIVILPYITVHDQGSHHRR